MGTHCSIGYEREDGTIVASYCHYDGYMSSTGTQLVRHYSDAQKVEELVALGSMSYLAENIYPSSSDHSFATPQGDVTVFYHRDRGESWKNTRPLVYDSFDEWFEANDQEYNYLFMEGSWMCRTGARVEVDIADTLNKECV